MHQFISGAHEKNNSDLANKVMVSCPPGARSWKYDMYFYENKVSVIRSRQKILTLLGNILRKKQRAILNISHGNSQVPSFWKD